MQIEISAKKRVLQGKGASRRLRGSGRVPGIIYGGENPAQAIELDHNDLYHQLKLEAFHASILTMDVEGKKERVLLRDIQMHPFKLQVLHIDFQRVDPNKKIHMKVPLHFVNADIAPGVKLSARHCQPRPYGTGCFLPAEGPARIYYGGSGRSGRWKYLAPERP